MENREIEVKFLEIDKEALIKKLRELGAEDTGDDFLKEAIFYDKEGRWQYDETKFVRIRQTSKGIFVTFKHKEVHGVTGTKEIEFTANDFRKVKDFLQEVGLVFFREQEKRRHKFLLGEVIVDIDTWPNIPTYVELEGPSEEAIKDAAQKLGFDWAKAEFGLAHDVVEGKYKVPVRSFKYFTFEKQE